MNKRISFYKYHGTGNDFIMIDHFGSEPILGIQDHDFISRLCDRHFGIGADGLIILEPDPEYHYFMRYFNADGRPGSFCGNGSRCCFAFARFLNIIGKETTFRASDGIHQAVFRNDKIYVKMQFTGEMQDLEDHLFLDTGSPHVIKFIDNIDAIDAYQEGKKIRNSTLYAKEGVNVNFVAINGDTLLVKTYERGVEDLTLSCGTGVTAAAIAYVRMNNLTGSQEVEINVTGGSLAVNMEIQEDEITNIWLGGPARQVFEGIWS